MSVCFKIEVGFCEHLILSFQKLVKIGVDFFFMECSPTARDTEDLLTIEYFQNFFFCILLKIL